jgi:DNA-binding transcriptional regulator YhcF (GntR family)
MQIVLSKDSDIPLRQQIAEQIVFLITTGQLQVGEELPSVRALGRMSAVHHNTVSDAYQELVRRGWLTRRRGTRLVVGKDLLGGPAKPNDLDDLINETIQRARNMGYTLQALRLRVRERLLEQPADHLLVVEPEPGLRDIICRELHDYIGWPTLGCSYKEFSREPGLAIGAQVVVATHLAETVKPLVSQSRPAIGIVYSQATKQVNLIRKLKNPSIVSIVSVSEGVLRTAGSLFAQAIGRRHTLNEELITPDGTTPLGDSDLIFCDTITFDMVRSRNKVHYRLIADDCLAHIASSLTSGLISAEELPARTVRSRPIGNRDAANAER